MPSQSFSKHKGKLRTPKHEQSSSCIFLYLLSMQFRISWILILNRCNIVQNFIVSLLNRCTRVNRQKDTYSTKVLHVACTGFNIHKYKHWKSGNTSCLDCCWEKWIYIMIIILLWSWWICLTNEKSMLLFIQSGSKSVYFVNYYGLKIWKFYSSAVYIGLQL